MRWCVAKIRRFIFGKADGGQTRTNESVWRGLGTDAYIFVSDINSLHAEFLDAGLAIVEGPTKRIYDRVEITIRDCNGFQLVFGE